MEPLPQLVRDFFEDARAWCKGRLPYFRLLLLVFFAYILIRHLGDSEYQSIFKPLNLGIHELGHVVFGIFGEFIGIAGGSLLQCLVPLASIAMFYSQRDYFAIAISFGWLSTNLFDVAVYLGDARAMDLPLVSPFAGDAIIHDWNYLLGAMGLLNADTTIAFLVRLAAIFSMLLCLIYGGWIIKQMFTTDAKED